MLHHQVTGNGAGGGGGEGQPAGRVKSAPAPAKLADVHLKNAIDRSVQVAGRLCYWPWKLPLDRAHRATISTGVTGPASGYEIRRLEVAPRSSSASAAAPGKASVKTKPVAAPASGVVDASALLTGFGLLTEWVGRSDPGFDTTRLPRIYFSNPAGDRDSYISLELLGLALPTPKRKYTPTTNALAPGKRQDLVYEPTCADMMILGAIVVPAPSTIAGTGSNSNGASAASSSSSSTAADSNCTGIPVMCCGLEATCEWNGETHYGTVDLRAVIRSDGRLHATFRKHPQPIVPSSAAGDALPQEVGPAPIAAEARVFDRVTDWLTAAQQELLVSGNFIIPQKSIDEALQTHRGVTIGGKCFTAVASGCNRVMQARLREVQCGIFRLKAAKSAKRRCECGETANPAVRPLSAAATSRKASSSRAKHNDDDDDVGSDERPGGHSSFDRFHNHYGRAAITDVIWFFKAWGFIDGASDDGSIVAGAAAVAALTSTAAAASTGASAHAATDDDHVEDCSRSPAAYASHSSDGEPLLQNEASSARSVQGAGTGAAASASGAAVTASAASSSSSAASATASHSSSTTAPAAAMDARGDRKRKRDEAATAHSSMADDDDDEVVFVSCTMRPRMAAGAGTAPAAASPMASSSSAPSRGSAATTATDAWSARPQVDINSAPNDDDDDEAPPPPSF